jgi:FAD/FMN-containing dehydrogenase
MLMRQVVPIDRIFSTPFDGVGCYSEREVVLLGGESRVDAVAALGDQNMKSVMDSFDVAEERKRAEPATDEPVILESESPAEGKVLSSEEDLKEFWKTDKKDYEWKERVAADLRERMLAAGITEEQLEELYAEIAKLSPDKDFQGLNINEWEGRIDAKEIGVSLDGNLLPSSLTNALFQAGLVDIT